MSQFSDRAQGKYLFETLNLTVDGHNETRSFKRTKELAEQGSNQCFFKNQGTMTSATTTKEKQKKTNLTYLKVSILQYSHWTTLKILEVIMNVKY